MEGLHRQGVLGPDRVTETGRDCQELGPRQWRKSSGDGRCRAAHRPVSYRHEPTGRFPKDLPASGDTQHREPNFGLVRVVLRRSPC